MRKHKAFTLIELLVVIAIIGILAGMIIVSLNMARRKSADARVQSDLNQARRLMMQYNINTNSYNVGTCENYDQTNTNNTGPTGPQCGTTLKVDCCQTSWIGTDDNDGSKAALLTLSQDITNQININNGGSVKDKISFIVNSNQNGFVIGAPLPSTIDYSGGGNVTSAKWWCFDQNGAMKIYDHLNLGPTDFVGAAYNSITTPPIGCN